MSVFEIQPNTKIMISHYTIDLPYARRFQLLFEQMDFEGTRSEVKTYFLDLNQIDLARDHPDALRALQHSEQMNVDVILHINSSPFHRAIEVLNHQKIISLGSSWGSIPIAIIDIDNCIGLLGDDLQRALLQAYDNPRHHIGKTDYKDIFSPENRRLMQQAAYLLRSVDQPNFEQKVLDALRDTDGRVDAAINYLSSIHETPDEAPNFLKNLPFLGKFVQQLEDQLNINVEQAVLDQYNQAFSQFHPYPPYHLKGRLFLSHSTRDIYVARVLQLMLETMGYHTVIFRLASFEENRPFDLMNEIEVISGLDMTALNIRYPDDQTLVYTLGAEVKASQDGVILLRSPYFDASFYTLLEHNFALHYGVPIFEFDIRDCVPRIPDVYDCLDEIIATRLGVDTQPPLQRTLDLELIPVALQAFRLLVNLKKTSAEAMTDELMALMRETNGAIKDAIRFITENGRVSLSDSQEAWIEACHLRYLYQG